MFNLHWYTLTPETADSLAPAADSLAGGGR
jgi:hypothetical protein